MAGGNITRITGGDFSTELSGGMTVHTDSFEMIAGKQNRLGGKKGTVKGIPKDPPQTGKYFIKGWWTDEHDKIITEATIGEKVKFHIQMDKSKVPASEKVKFILKDWDDIANIDDEIKIYSTIKDTKTNIFPEINEFTINNNGEASIFLNLSKGLLSYVEDDAGDEIELYFECTYYDVSDKETQTIDLPEQEHNYLIVSEKEVKITVFIELPHSLETGWGGKGLAGHSAMAIGERYFDYGPNNTPGKYSEKDYDVDFNNDGDKDDIVQIDTPSFHNSPGMPWWGTFIASKNKIKPEDVTLDMVTKYIKLHWLGKYDPVSGDYPDATNIYGTVNQIEFYVKESEANKMIVWWEERYKHLKVYSVWPWTGEQCTTTVKTAIQQAFPVELGRFKNLIADVTQKPSGLLSELKNFVSTSKQNKDKQAIVNVIKPESIDWKP
jgi:hypothetical protein